MTLAILTSFFLCSICLPFLLSPSIPFQTILPAPSSPCINTFNNPSLLILSLSRNASTPLFRSTFSTLSKG
jgi:hypothetical protein